MHMLEPNSETTVESSRLASVVANDGTLRRTAALLDELLVHSIKLRDLYKSARWQTADIQFRGLRILFDDHYKEQLRLVDVLLDRLRTLGGAGRVLAGLLLQGTQFSCALRGRVSPTACCAIFWMPTIRCWPRHGRALKVMNAPIPHPVAILPWVKSCSSTTCSSSQSATSWSLEATGDASSSRAKTAWMRMDRLPPAVSSSAGLC
jgi:hypothetical protein